MSLKPVFWIVFVVAGAAALAALGVWQLGRLEERRAENALIAARLSRPPLTITGAPLDPQALEYHPVVVTGVYDYDEEIVLRNRARNNVPGVHVLTPLLIEGSGRAVLIDRGWIPYQYASPDDRAGYDRPAGAVTVTGLLRLSQPGAWIFGPVDPPINADNPRTDAWFWVNLPHIQQQFRAYELLPFYIEQGPAAEAAALPAPGHALDLSDGPHLTYAVQWFAFGAILVVGSLALWRSNRRRAAARKDKHA